MAIRNLWLRARNFIRTGSLRLPALSSNISAATAAKAKIVEVKQKIEAHKNDNIVNNIALDALEGAAHAVAQDHALTDSRAAKLLEAL